MTIAIGLLSSDGVVLAADTQEIMGSLKSDESKLIIANRGLKDQKAGALAITGAGDSGYLDSINMEICTSFVAKEPWTGAKWAVKLKKHVKDFHNDYVVPYGTFPESDRPHLRLVIGGNFSDPNFGDYRAVWSTDKSTVSMAKNYCAVGLGSAQAYVMLRRFWTIMDTVKAASLAAYVVFHVKHSVDGCGNETQIVILKNGYAEYVPAPNIELMENYFDERALLENQLLHFSLGMDLPEDDIKFTLARFSSILQKNRKDIIDCQNFKMQHYRRGERPVDQPEIRRHTKARPSTSQTSKDQQ